MVKLEEKRVSLPQVEAALISHPSVRAAAVVLLTGKRHRTLHNWIFMFLDYEVKAKAYICLLTDERSPLTPDN